MRSAARRAWQWLRTPGRFERALLKILDVRNRKLPPERRVVIPRATYSPWRDDREFHDTFTRVQNNSLVDIYRCYELWGLVAEVAPVPGDVLEVGVWRGGTGCLMAERARRLGIDGTVYLCDTFAGVVKAGGEDNVYVGGEHANTSIAQVEALRDSLQLTNIEILVGIFPDDTAVKIEDHTFRLCHIDVDVYESAKGVFEWVWPKVAPGGVVVFDDYGFVECEGVTRFVNEQRGHTDRRFVHNLNGHGIFVKLGAPNARDR